MIALLLPTPVAADSARTPDAHRPASSGAGNGGAEAGDPTAKSPARPAPGRHRDGGAAKQDGTATTSRGAAKQDGTPIQDRAPAGPDRTAAGDPSSSTGRDRGITGSSAPTAGAANVSTTDGSGGTSFPSDNGNSRRLRALQSGAGAEPATGPATSPTGGMTPAATSPVTASGAAATRLGRRGAAPARTSPPQPALASTPAFSPVLAPSVPRAQPAATGGHHAAHRTRLRPSFGMLPFLRPVDAIVGVVPGVIWIALAALGAAAVALAITATAAHRRARRAQRAVSEATWLAQTDPLTGLLNRRGFERQLEREIGRARRYDHPLTVAYVDVEGLKRINDTHGHGAGDEVLRTVGQLLSDEARTEDMCARIGGDEYAVLLVEQDSASAAEWARRITGQLPQERERLGLTTRWGLTIGLASAPYDGGSAEDLLLAADRRLYAVRGIAQASQPAAMPAPVPA